MKVVIIEDEPKPAQLLHGLIRDYCPSIQTVHVAHTVAEARSYLISNAFDLLFLDIEMPGMDGFELLESLENKINAAIIFTTAHAEHAVRAFRVNAVDFLLKPIAPRDLIKAVEKATDVTPSPAKQMVLRISVYDGNEYHIVSTNELIRLEANGSYTNLILSKGDKLMSSKRLKIYESLLETGSFFRCHKSHLVNINHIKSYSLADGGTLKLSTGEIVPLSLSRKQELLTLLKV
ncbi:MAG: LytR/AlgR family response regulator transcription factor [Owenweeksia sp.]